MRREMLRDLALLLGDGDAGKGLDAAVAFLRRYEGDVVCRLRSQYQRIRARDMHDRGYSYNSIAEALDVSVRHVFNLLHR